MAVGIYLLKLDKLSDPEFLERFLQKSPQLVDETRRRKAERIRQPRAKAVSLAAGLLLRKVYLDHCRSGVFASAGGGQGDRTDEQGDRTGGKESQIPEIGIGENGKPYFKDCPLHFNLSHSGDYILCAVSDREVGADIQRTESCGKKRPDAAPPGGSPEEISEPLEENDPAVMETAREKKIARRFFAENEAEAIEACRTPEEASRLFYRLWTKKEAYGKLTGEGLAAVIGEDISAREDLKWISFQTPEGYEAAVCVRKMQDNGNRNRRGVNVWED